MQLHLATWLHLATYWKRKGRPSRVQFPEMLPRREEVAREEFLWTEEGTLEDLQEAFPQWEGRFQSYIDRL
ncbi:hypothetical protein [Salinibacter ruber]|jgi:hypothetical protein|uniref:hypothetical protein n=1 Tax=Salinibacter ruber TaxID=146919 RepID=UPI002073A0D5|nr:hypothetical protein [Salinibacter ruber]